MGDFFAFRTLITPRFIQALFVLGLIGLVLVFIGLVASDEALAGILFLVFGTLYWRIVCELFFVLFRISDTLVSIKGDTAALSPGPIAVPASLDPTAERPTAIVEPSAIETAPEGWYDDPDRPGGKRWWDGTTWGMRDDEHPSSEGPPSG
jgi:hypothetical protein